MPARVRFGTRTRIHISLDVADLGSSVAFYRALFEREPSKERPGYARFEIDDPPVNLALNEVGGAPPAPRLSHLGIQVQRADDVSEESSRLADAGLRPATEKDVTCCHAVQDKAWVADPDGVRWEVFAVLDDSIRA
jgi:catechol 2,3-dioxygenase-like lactoylglutathione lyase family enzyme